MHPWWQITLIVIGILSVISIILGLFFTFGDSADEEWATELPPVNSPDFLAAIARLSNSPIEQDGDIKIFNNGDEFVPAFVAALRNAQKTINISVYIWSAGIMSDQITPVLLERALAGVEVRILLDGFGGYNAPADKFEELKKAGVIIHKFRAIKLGKLSRFNRRSHRRAIVIDGRVGFTGGMAIADHWLGQAQDPDHWRDNMFEVHGCMAQSLQAAFAQLWAGTCGEILAGQKFYPTISADPKNSGTRYVNLLSTPASEAQPLPKFFWLSIACAKQSIYINSPYFVPDTHVKKALEQRARAGVDVRMLVPNNKTDAKPIRLAGHYYYQDLLEAGVKIYEYQPTMIHSKIIVVDGQWSVIGSANMDIRSVLLNEENVMGILSVEFAKELTRVFEDNLRQARALNLRDWQKRSFIIKILEWVFVKFSKQY